MIKNTKQGFSLIELSIILTIAAAIMVSLLSWTNPEKDTNAIKAAETRKNIDVVIDAIDNFRIQFKRLPCPSDHTLKDNDSAFGKENITFNNVDPVCADISGAIPTKNLGLPISYTIDKWGRRILYHVSSNLCTDVATNISNIANTLPEGNCTPHQYNNNDGNITITDITGTPITTKAAYALLSFGGNGKGARLPSGLPYFIAVSTSPNEQENYDFATDSTFVQASFGNGFDDIIAYRSKEYIESSITNLNQTLVEESFCNDNSNIINEMTADLADSLDIAVNYFGLEEDDIAIMRMLWTMQGICEEELETWSGQQCPGGSINGAVMQEDGSCLCENDNWNNGCQ